jgi:hypothetical protein
MKPRLMLILFGFLVSALSVISIIQQSQITGLASLTDTLTNKLNFPVSSNFYIFVLLGIGIIAMIIGVRERKVVY